ncbi:PEGA domain-containing protein [Planctomycetota bacterium]|nr:PEGA domain-containing protein [Planctomycetota bacterium]
MKRDAKMMRSGLLLSGLIASTVLAGGCVQRKIKINSHPDGALVYLNDQEVGRTPVEVNFLWYGTYDVRLTKDGYLPLWTTAEAIAPGWETPPIDFFAEVFTDNTVLIDWEFELEPYVKRPETPDELLENAAQMKKWTDGTEPLPSAEAGEQTENITVTEEGEPTFEGEPIEENM